MARIKVTETVITPADGVQTDVVYSMNASEVGAVACVATIIENRDRHNVPIAVRMETIRVTLEFLPEDE